MFPKHFQPHTRTFLEGLLERDPGLRFGISEIKTHPYFAGVDWDKLLNKEYAAPMIPRLRDELDLSYFDPQVTQDSRGQPQGARPFSASAESRVFSAGSEGFSVGSGIHHSAAPSIILWQMRAWVL